MPKSSYDESQATTQIAILQKLTGLLREGSITNALIATTPGLSDAAILTGIAYGTQDFGSFVEAWGLRIATQQAPGRWPGRDNHYVTRANVFATFFHGDSYDDEVLWYTENIR
ncbi:hypothetical protein BDZ45DRAFT_721221 [Acephala macrosclerotiorum]|nr:hypothetical protein BDZ45DRAFT_721221 [Acephala macrosclerotiorum]